MCCCAFYIIYVNAVLFFFCFLLFLLLNATVHTACIDPLEDCTHCNYQIVTLLHRLDCEVQHDFLHYIPNTPSDSLTVLGLCLKILQ